MCTIGFPCDFSPTNTVTGIVTTADRTIKANASIEKQYSIPSNHLPVPLHLYFYPFASPGSTTITATIASIIDKAIFSCAQLIFLAINKCYRTILQLTQPRSLMRALHNYYHYHNNLTYITSLTSAYHHCHYC